jgi:serine/threonine protein kinase
MLQVPDRSPAVGVDEHLPPLLLPRCIARKDLEVGAKIGVGAFGVVHIGTLRRSGTVAIKVLDVAHVAATLGFSPDETVRAFYWEALNLALVDHPNIIGLVGVCVDGGAGMAHPDTAPFRALVLEFCADGDLQRPLHAPAPDIWRWGVQLAEALRCLHASGQVHRDIKGGNVLLTAGRTIAKFADLGVADADFEFVGEKLSNVRGFTQKDVRWAAPEELEACRKVRAAVRILPYGAVVRGKRHWLGPVAPALRLATHPRQPMSSASVSCCCSYAGVIAQRGGPRK